MIDPIVLVTMIFAAVVLYFWNDNGSLRRRNQQLETQVEALYQILERYLRVEKEESRSPVREEKIDRVLEELRNMRTGAGGMSIHDSNVRVGRDMVGNDKNES